MTFESTLYQPLVAMSIVIDTGTRVTAPFLKLPVYIDVTKEVNGTMFWKALKSGNDTERLLSGASARKTRPLASTTILGDLSALRDLACDERVDQVVAPKIALEFGDAPARPTTHTIEPNGVLTITAPSIIGSTTKRRS